MLILLSVFAGRRELKRARATVRPLDPCEEGALAEALERRLKVFGARACEVLAREDCVEVTVRGKDPEEIIRASCRRGLAGFHLRATEIEGEVFFEVRRRWDLARPSEIEEKRIPHRLRAAPELAVERFERVEFHSEGFDKNPVIELEFAPADAERMRRIFEAHPDEEMALVVDGEVRAVARIEGEMRGSRLQLRNLVDRAGARRLSELLSAGALPCEVEILSLEPAE